ncbi:hypothetical protein [Mucilaginibacter pineti]|uniref:hypothetical protein n=1 Tax=Mucilaginibacter pineti TaxID=1391627 RepID=UPI00115F9D5D|nr:hypothetical protein [Mucilaginibacter pineti]
MILSRKDVKNTRTAGDEWLYMLQPNFDAGILFFDDHKKTWIARGTKHFAKFEDMVTCINKLNSGVHPR